MAKQVSFIQTGSFYGINTFAGASSGLWLIARIIWIGEKSATYETQNGPGIFEQRKCLLSDIYDLEDCAKESISNRPEYAAAYQRYL